MMRFELRQPAHLGQNNRVLATTKGVWPRLQRCVTEVASEARLQSWKASWRSGITTGSGLGLESSPAVAPGFRLPIARPLAASCFPRAWPLHAGFQAE